MFGLVLLVLVLIDLGLGYTLAICLLVYFLGVFVDCGLIAGVCVGFYCCLALLFGWFAILIWWVC